MITKQHCDRVIEILGQNGENRLKHVYYDNDQPNCFCLIGAFAKVIDPAFPINILSNDNLTFSIHEELKTITGIDCWLFNDKNDWPIVYQFIKDLRDKLLC